MSARTYSLFQVTQLTGIKAHTLRVWERRYNFLIAQRKSSGARIYSEEEVKILLNVRILLSSGFRISKIVQMSEEEIFNETNKIYATKRAADEVFVQSLIKAMLDFDESLFKDIFKKLLETKGVFGAFTSVIYPFLRRVGGLWISDKIIPVQEHFISNLIRQKLISAIDQLPEPRDKAKSVILFLPESEGHEIGLLMAYYAFKNAGWKVIYLGLRVPLEDLDKVIDKVGSHYGFAFIQIPGKEYSELLMNILSRNTQFNLLLSGSRESMDELIEHQRCSFLENPNALLEFLQDQ